MIASITAHVRRAIIGLALLFSVGCAGSVDMPRVASSLDAAKALWHAACEPKPVDVKVCNESFDAINELVDAYTELNGALQ